MRLATCGLPLSTCGLCLSPVCAAARRGARRGRPKFKVATGRRFSSPRFGSSAAAAAAASALGASGEFDYKYLLQQLGCLRSILRLAGSSCDLLARRLLAADDSICIGRRRARTGGAQLCCFRPSSSVFTRAHSLALLTLPAARAGRSRGEGGRGLAPRARRPRPGRRFASSGVRRRTQWAPGALARDASRTQPAPGGGGGGALATLFSKATGGRDRRARLPLSPSIVQTKGALAELRRPQAAAIDRGARARAQQAPVN